MLKNIEAERARLGLTMLEVGKELGITPETYSSYVHRKRPIPSDTLVLMTKLFGKTADYLLGLTDE